MGQKHSYEKNNIKKKMKKIIIIILLQLLFVSTSYAEVVKKIVISGNTRVSDETVKIYGDIKTNQDYTEKDLNKTLISLYSTNFFEDVQINLINGELKISLIEYPVINTLLLIGEPNSKYEEKIRKLIKSKQKDSFIKKNLSTDIRTIKKLYASLGFNFVTVETKIREIDASTLDLSFEIVRGEKSKIKKITFTGDKKIREKKLRDIIASEEDKFWKFISRNTSFNENLINLDTRLMTNYYKSIGYYDVKISSNSAEIKKSGDIEIIYTIDAGARYYIKKIITNTDTVFDKNIFYPLEKEYKKLIGSYYSPFKTKKLLENIDDLIAQNNLQFVEHNVEEITENDTIIIKFNIFEGEKVLVERINILGNNVTNEVVIRSELLLDEGDPFTKLKLDKSIARIKSRNIFSSVKPEVLDGSDNNLKVVNITVEEKPTGEISAGAGIGTNGGTVAFVVKENNWLGKGSNVSFDVDASAESLRGTVSYSNPNYDFLGNSLTYRLGSTSNDKPNQGYENTVLSAGASTTFEQFKDLYATLGISGSYDELNTDSTASSSLKTQSGDFAELIGEYGFTYDKRNRSFMPTSGYVAGFDQSVPLYADKAFLSNRLFSSFYKEINQNLISATKFYASAVNGLNGDDVRISKRQSLSSNRLRGFERNKVGPVDGLDHIGGNFAAVINFEAQLPNFLPEATKTDVGFFLDIGNVWGVDYDSTIDDSNKIRSSTGAAASWNSPVGPMTFILSTNLSKASTDVTESFNFNLGTTF